MTFRQFGAALGVALVNIVIDRRESLHSGRLLEHLQDGRANLGAWLGSVSSVLVQRGGQGAVDSAAGALNLLHRESERQASVLAYADVFRVMALIGVVALTLTPLMSPQAKKA
jgi:DHA2 family multidrug resistance protein